MKNGEKLEIFDEKWGFPGIYLTCRGFWSKIVGGRRGEGRVLWGFPGFIGIMENQKK